MNTAHPSILSFESKLHHLHAFTVVASIEGFSELNDDIQQTYLAGVSELALELKSDFQALCDNNNIQS